jgi:two-component system, sensor histidine kinase and response regulator
MHDQQLPRVLIVDDETAQVRALCDTLRDQGYETTGFTSGERALAAFREARYDLLLTDLMMPEMDGIALLRLALEIDPHIVGIIMTGEGTITTAVEAMKSGALDYILKPFKLSVILPVLSRALAMRRLRLENAELEHEIRKRTAELEAANRELESFSYSVSHDLRAPLRAISGFSTILNADYSTEIPIEAQSLLNDIALNVQRMNRLINDLLRFSQLSRQSLSKQLVDITTLVHDVLKELRKEQGDRQIEVRVGVMPESIGDPALLKQVFINLLSNAFKFTRFQEQAVVEVGCRHQDGEDIYFIQDNGAGFDMRYAGKLFGVFQRLHSAEKFEGTGIGLSLVHRIIQRHGGRLWAEAEVNKGAAFYFVLPN